MIKIVVMKSGGALRTVASFHKTGQHSKKFILLRLAILCIIIVNFDKCIEYTITCKHIQQELHVGCLHLGYLPQFYSFPCFPNHPICSQ